MSFPRRQQRTSEGLRNEGCAADPAGGFAREHLRRWGTALLGLGLGVAVLVVFQPLLDGDFFLDDFVNLYDLANYGLLKLLVSPHGGHPKGVSNVLFAVLHALFGLNPRPWFAVVVALHVANTLLFFDLLRRLRCRRSIAAVLTAVWGLAPVQAGVLGWFAAWGHALIGTLMLLMLRDMVHVSAQNRRVSWPRAFYWSVLALAAANSYGMGAGVAAALCVTAAAFVPNARGRLGLLALFAMTAVLVPILYAAQHALYHRLADVSLYNATPVLDASVARLIRAMAPTASLTGELVVSGLGTLILGSNLAHTAGVLMDRQMMWLHALVPVLLLAVVVAVGADRSRRAQVAGLAALAVAVYGVIAWGTEMAGRVATAQSLSGWSTSTVSSMQALTPRHHYVGTMALAAMLALGLETVASRGMRSRRAVALVLAAVVVGLALRLPADRVLVQRGVVQRKFLALQRRVLREIERSVQAARPGEVVYIENRPFLFGLHQDFLPGWAAISVIYHPGGTVHGRTIRFVERDAELLAILRAQEGTPIAQLVVSPAEMAAAR